MGQRFRERDETVGVMLSSPARRAHTTAQLFAQNCAYEQRDILVEEDLYFSGGGSIERLIQEQGSAAESLMLVFHNPDITAFANSLDYDLHIGNVPTAGLVCFSCAIEHWSDFTRDCTRFEYFDFPKNPSDVVIRE